MNVNPINIISFRSRPYKIKETDKEYGVVKYEMIELKNEFLELYTAFGKDNKKIHKLYYLKDKLGNFIKSKLVYFSNNKKYKTIYSSNKSKDK